MSRSEIENKPLGHLDSQLAESLSALIDGEVDELSLKRLLSHQDQDAVNQAWSSLVSQQQLNESTLPHDAFADVNLLSAVQAGIEDELTQPVVDKVAVNNTNQPVAEQRSPWFKPLANFAVAASVAVVTVFAVGQFSAVDAPVQPQGLMANQFDDVNSQPLPVQPKQEVADVQPVQEAPVQAINAGRVMPVSSQGLQGMVVPASAELRFNTYSGQDELYDERNIQQLLERHRQSSSH